MGSKKESISDKLEKVTEQQALTSKTPVAVKQQTTLRATTTTTSKYVREFESLFMPIKIEQLRVRAQNGQLRHCQYRSLCWRYFLKCLPEGFDEWLECCNLSRKRYEVIRDKNLRSIKPNFLVRAPEIATTTTTTIASNLNATPIQSERINSGDNLSSEDGRYQARREDKHYSKAPDECDHKSVFKTIERDVVRTFPDMEFFKQAEIQTVLENVLFNFARENPQISYKQGMHELLATLLYVAHTDSQNCYINYKGNLASETIATLLDLKYLEHDVFHLFSALMKSIETWYQNDEILTVPESPKLNRTRMSDNNGFINRSSSSSKQQVNSVLGVKLKKISENIVRHYDRELFNHLEALQIAPQIYGIRWMRLLFGREFEFLDLLMVWDAIICDQTPMSLLDYVFASMLITIREELVNGDYTDCLNNLMRHQFKDVSSVIKLALYLRDPITNPRPKLHNPSVGLTKYKFKSNPNNLNLHKNQMTSATSLTSKLSQQYISHKQYLRQQISNTRHQQQPHHAPIVPRNTNDLILSAESVVKEYEMREMQSSPSTSTNSLPRSANRFPMGKITNRGEPSSSLSNVLNSSAESYDDLHSIVDYCWRLLSEQIDSLQKCLPKEKSLTSEDEIFVALAQLKKVRDVLKGSLRLEDELDSVSASSGSKY